MTPKQLFFFTVVLYISVLWTAPLPHTIYCSQNTQRTTLTNHHPQCRRPQYQAEYTDHAYTTGETKRGKWSINRRRHFFNYWNVKIELVFSTQISPKSLINSELFYQKIQCGKNLGQLRVVHPGNFRWIRIGEGANLNPTFFERKPRGRRLTYRLQVLVKLFQVAIHYRPIQTSLSIHKLILSPYYLRTVFHQLPASPLSCSFRFRQAPHTKASRRFATTHALMQK